MDSSSSHEEYQMKKNLRSRANLPKINKQIFEESKQPESDDSWSVQSEEVVTVPFESSMNILLTEIDSLIVHRVKTEKSYSETVSKILSMQNSITKRDLAYNLRFGILKEVLDLKNDKTDI